MFTSREQQPDVIDETLTVQACFRQTVLVIKDTVSTLLGTPLKSNVIHFNCSAMKFYDTYNVLFLLTLLERC